jgi:hypothetical protein
VTGASGLLAGVVSAKGDEHTITGTLDATKAGETPPASGRST